MERIGEGLRRIGKLDDRQVEQVVSAQDNGDKRLFGEIAVNLDYISIGDLLCYLYDSRQSGHDVT
jgi:hypothetical protein